MRKTGEQEREREREGGEEHLTAEDWAIMAAVEKRTVWRSLKALHLRRREKLLAAIMFGLSRDGGRKHRQKHRQLSR